MREKRHKTRDTVRRQTDFNVNIAQCVLFDKDRACARQDTNQKTLSDGKVKVGLLPWQLYVLFHCRTTVPGSGSGP